MLFLPILIYQNKNNFYFCLILLPYFYGASLTATSNRYYNLTKPNPTYWPGNGFQVFGIQI